MRQSPLGVIELSPWGEVVAWNPTAERIFGYTEAEVLGCPLTLLVAEERREAAFGWWRRFIAAEVPGYAQWESVRRDGSRISCDYHLARLTDQRGALLGVVTMVADLTAGKRADRERRRLWQAVEQSPVTVVITDPQGHIEYVNPAFERCSGYTAAEVMGQNPSVLKSGQHDPAFYAAMWRTALSGEVWHGEMCNRRKSGELFWEQVSISPARDEQGAITSLVALKEDVTARREAALELERRNAELRASHDRLSELERVRQALVRMIVHDLKSPLAVMISNARTVRRELPAEGDLAEAMDDVVALGGVMDRMILDVLDVTRSEEARMVARLDATEVGPLLRDVVQRAEGPARQSGKEVSLDLAPSAPGRVDLDPNLVRRLLENLLDNAFKYAPRGTAVRVEAAAGEPGWWLLRVHDLGPGVPPEHRQRIFEPYVRLERDLGRAARASRGLGLAFCRMAAEAHGGGIEVRDGAQGGSLFEARLPVSPPQR